MSRTLLDILNSYTEQCSDKSTCINCEYKGGRASRHIRTGTKKVGRQICMSDFLHKHEVPTDTIDSVLSAMTIQINNYCGGVCSDKYSWEKCLICFLEKHIDCTVTIPEKEYVLVEDIGESWSLMFKSTPYEDMLQQLLDNVNKKTRKDLV